MIVVVVVWLCACESHCHSLPILGIAGMQHVERSVHESCEHLTCEMQFKHVSARGANSLPPIIRVASAV